MSPRIPCLLLGLLLAPAACVTDDGAPASTGLESGGGALTWVGDTHLGVAGVWLPPTLAPAAGHRLDVYTQTYPIGSAARVDLYWLDGSGAVDSAPMVVDADGVGSYGNNTQWRASLPGDVMVDGQTVQYWIRAQGQDGRVLWDSRYGDNYRVEARRYDIAWMGGLGSWRPVSGDYVEGGLFNRDGATATGCWNHGVSTSSYRERAVRVWAPGLTDRALDDAELEAASAMVDVELYTDAGTSGWQARPARFAERRGNDFVYSFRFVDFTPVCIDGLGDGTYAFKLRGSTDGGAHWFWRGSANGPGGGDDLLVQYAARCSYFDDPTDCIPTETPLTHRITGGPVVVWNGTSIGATSTFTRELPGDGTAPVTVRNIALRGPDADQFGLELFDVTHGSYVDPAGPFNLDAGDELRVIVVHRPTVASPGSLPQQATVTWVEEGAYGPARTIQGIYLRGYTAP